MSKIIVITDTDSSLPTTIADQFNIIQVPITIHFGEKTFFTGVDIDDHSLFEQIDKIGRLPTTAAPPPAAFSKAYQQAFDQGAESIICVCVSSKISNTYNSALTAVEDFPDRRISVVDSLSLSLGQGFMALEAAEAIKNGLTHDEVVLRTQSIQGRVHLMGYLTTLKYLAMGGRVGKLAAGMADVLNIHPILTMQEGKLELLEKVRTRKAAINRVVELVNGLVESKIFEKVAFFHVNNLTGADQLRELISSRISLPESVMTVEFGAGLSVHTGSGMVGIAFIPK